MNIIPTLTAVLILLVFSLQLPAHAMTPDQVAVYFAIGNSSTDDSHRRVKYDIDSEDGWQRFVAEHVQPVLDLGVVTIELHNPGGVAWSDGFMRFDQFSLADEAGLDFKNDFHAAFSPLVKQGVRVIGYIGSPDDIPVLFDRDGTYDAEPGLDADDAWIKANPYIMRDLRWNILNEFRHFRRAGVDLAIDRASPKGPEGLSFWIVHGERVRGRQPVIEPTATRAMRHWWDTDQLVLYRTFYPWHIEGAKQSHLDRFPQLGKESWYTGTTFVLFRNTVRFTQGSRAGQVVRLWRDATPLVEWWNEIRELDPEAKIVPMMGRATLERLIKQDLLKELAD